MGLQEKFEKHWLGIIVLVAAIVATATWTVLNQVLVRPRDEELGRLDRRLEELKPTETVRPTPSAPSSKQPIPTEASRAILEPTPSPSAKQAIQQDSVRPDLTQHPKQRMPTANIDDSQASDTDFVELRDLFAQLEVAIDLGEYDDAKSIALTITSKYPHTQQAEKARKILNNIESIGSKKEPNEQN